MNSFSAAVGAYAPTKLRNRIKNWGPGYRTEAKTIHGKMVKDIGQQTGLGSKWSDVEPMYMGHIEPYFLITIM